MRNFINWIEDNGIQNVAAIFFVLGMLAMKYMIKQDAKSKNIQP